MTNNFNEMTDYERGEYDCVHNHPVSDNESPDYYSGYNDAYAQEQIADARTILQEKQYERV